MALNQSSSDVKYKRCYNAPPHIHLHSMYMDKQSNIKLNIPVH